MPTNGRLMLPDVIDGLADAGRAMSILTVDSVKDRDPRYTVRVMSDGKLMNADELRAAVGFTGMPR